MAVRKTAAKVPYTEESVQNSLIQKPKIFVKTTQAIVVKTDPGSCVRIFLLPAGRNV